MVLYRDLLSFVFFFFIYSFLGWCTEVLYAGICHRRFVNRGFLNGPVCPIYGFGVVSVISILTPVQHRLFLLYVLSVVLVTALEGLTGLVLDKLFHHKWWDYSNRPLNIGGYVCLSFSLLWGVACVLIVRVIHPALAFAVGFLPLLLLALFDIILAATMATDTLITVLGILKFNRRLALLGQLSDEFAAELKRISDQIGQELFDRLKVMLDRQESLNGENLPEQVSAEIRERLSFIHEKLENARLELSTPTFIRLVKAFPRQTSKKYGKIMAEPKARLAELTAKLKEQRKRGVK